MDEGKERSGGGDGSEGRICEGSKGSGYVAETSKSEAGQSGRKRSLAESSTLSIPVAPDNFLPHVGATLVALNSFQ
jgi:hypothetical protein